LSLNLDDFAQGRHDLTAMGRARSPPAVEITATLLCGHINLLFCQSFKLHVDISAIPRWFSVTYCLY
jgi:hypothetical protein